MTTNGDSAQDLSSQPAGLTIGDLARRTGLTPATLRTWEARHGFPQPQRRGSGHRRYDEGVVPLVELVLRRREAGVRLERAIEEAAAALAPGPPSVYAELRRTHPELAPHRLRKRTLLALTWAIEDESCARAQHPLLFAAFQHERYYRQARDRWAELARTARATTVFADFGGRRLPVGDPALVDLPGTAPLRREWFVICDAPDFPAAMTAWELPGQRAVPDLDRVFEAAWSLDPRVVRTAARAAARLAGHFGHRAAADLLARLEGTPAAPGADLLAATALFNRVVAYADREAGRVLRA